MSDTFKEYLHECFQGEVLGEALGRALAESAQDADHRQKWRFLEQLERETKERIRAALEALGEQAEEDPIQKSKGQTWAAKIASQSWSETMIKLKPALEKYIRYFEKNEKLAPADGRLIAQQITQHERAWLEFAICEIEGNSDKSLAPIQRLLDNLPLVA